MTIDGGVQPAGKRPGVVVDGGGTHRILESSDTLTVRGLTLRDGFHTFEGGCVRAAGKLVMEQVRVQSCRAKVRGGGVYVTGEVVLRDCRLTGNEVTGDQAQDGGGAVSMEGGALFERCAFDGNRSASTGGAVMMLKIGTARVVASSFSDNRSVDTGGAWVNHGTTVMVNTTLVDNGGASQGYGGAIANGGTMTLRHCTLTRNHAKQGSSVSSSGQLHVINTVVGVGDGGPDCHGSLTSDVGSWVADGSCAAKRSGDPLLNPPLPQPDGRVFVPPHPLSPLRDSGDPSSCGADSDVPSDAAGQARPADGGCDIGAIERPQGQCASASVALPEGRCLRVDGADLNLLTDTTALKPRVTVHTLPPGNLVLNGDAEAEHFAGWALTNGGDGWGIHQGGLFGGKAFVASYEPSTMVQVVPLARAGLPMARFDSASPPPVHVGVFGHGHGQAKEEPPGNKDDFTVDVRPISASGKVGVPVWTQSQPVDIGDTRVLYKRLAKLPPGTRALRIAITADDAEYNKGHYGTLVDGIFVTVGDYEMRLANDEQPFGAWQDFHPRLLSWDLGDGDGQRIVRVEVRDKATGTLLSAMSTQALGQ